jgi:benzoate/toluate 1,2-dioxygenase reductase component
VEGLTPVLEVRQLSERTFTLSLARPPGFSFQPGQSIVVGHAGVERSYSLASGPHEDQLLLCIRRVPGGALSPALCRLSPGDTVSIRGPRGYFLHEPGPRAVVLAATGTGVAPFLSMVRAGLRGFTLLHGVSGVEDLCFAGEIRAAARLLVPCVSPMRVTLWAAENLPRAEYDLYLCGNRDMIRDFTLLADERFPGSRVFTEVFH